MAGSQREDSFALAMELAVQRDLKHFVETGCYRGIDADGRSSELLSRVAAHQQGSFVSLDNNPHHVELARARVPFGEVRLSDSIEGLRLLTSVDFVYLDSYDYEPHNPEPSQLHMLAEVGAIVGILPAKGLILLDDCNIPGGGKGLLADRFLRGRGWNLLHDKYQKLYSR